MKIGVFSGSFDPVHVGHAMVANYLSQFCGLDRVWIMPSPLNPLKAGHPPVSNEHRYAMCGLVAEKCHAAEVSDFEFEMPLPSYTYRTLCGLRDKYPQHEFSLVIGSDNWLVFDQWKNWREIVEEFRIIVYPRPGYPVTGEQPENVTVIADAPQALISSTFIRNSIAENRNMNFFITPEVFEYIRKNRLYE